MDAKTHIDRVNSAPYQSEFSNPAHSFQVCLSDLVKPWLASFVSLALMITPHHIRSPKFGLE